MTAHESASEPPEIAGHAESFLSSNISGKDRYTYTLADDSSPAYQLSPDSRVQVGVPRGSITRSRHRSSGVYPGVERDWRLYIPAQYDGTRQAAVIVFQDGHEYLGPLVNAAVVLDNLIARQEIPLCLAVFVEPGDVGPGYPIFGGNDNRSLEYDSTDGEYGRFLIEELLPAALDGLSVSTSPRDWAIVGISSGGNAAWTAAWHRPDVFGNVIAHCGSFIDIRGGHNHSPTIRRTARKPIRVWHQTGDRDLDVVFGNIQIANRDFAAALDYRRYDSKLVWGTGGHSLLHGGAVFPETLRWIWRDHPDVVEGL